MLMTDQLIWQGRIDTTGAGASSVYNTPPIRGGGAAKVASFAVVVEQKSSNNMRITLTLNHGPDGRNFVQHSVPIAITTLGTAIPPTIVLIGDADPTKVLHDYLQVTLQADSVAGNTPEWALIQVYQILKPF